MNFHHIQLYVDELRSIDHYKCLETSLNKLVNQEGTENFGQDISLVEQARIAWTTMHPNAPKESEYSCSGQDIVEQLLIGLGWRITAYNQTGSTSSVIVTSPDPSGIQIIVTAPSGPIDSNMSKKLKNDEYSFLHVDRWNDFISVHSHRQGIAVLGFRVSSQVLDKIRTQYENLHPKLLVPWGHVSRYGSLTILEVFSYYAQDKKSADTGTVLRFVDIGSSGELLPGFTALEASFSDGMVAYSDHWVSNVHDREGFLSTLSDTLGFSSKVDFNAGVVAAGQAIIESTVTGNTTDNRPSNKNEVLKDQSQIFLPINNALSEVGHVHLFLKEIGQGVQHVACRVENLVAFIKRANHYRMATGQGFSFLRIPRSYYGRLVSSDLPFESSLSSKVYQRLIDSKLVSPAGVVELQISTEDMEFLKNSFNDEDNRIVSWSFEELCSVVKRHRYNNLYSLLRDNLSEESYVSIVANKILVDIQGDDILYQIFTSNILQRTAGEESPFMEFIQRVCSQKVDKNGVPKSVKPGCGGFGIRNFLTLFLSIEVSKAMTEFDQASSSGNDSDAQLARSKIDLFTEQLEESNPILTQISDAMTLEGDLLDEPQTAEVVQQLANAREQKMRGQQTLQAVSDKYSARYAALTAQ